MRLRQGSIHRSAQKGILRKKLSAASSLGQHLRAASLWGAARTLREDIGIPWRPAERLLHAPLMNAARSQLDEAAWKKAFAEGKAMGLEEAVDYALSEEERATHAPELPSDDEVPAALTRREGEVAAMVARGLSNRQIASELFISERTVENHVSKILRKLEIDSRTEVAAWAIERRLLTPDPD